MAEHMTRNRLLARITLLSLVVVSAIGLGLNVQARAAVAAPPTQSAEAKEAELREADIKAFNECVANFDAAYDKRDLLQSGAMVDRLREAYLKRPEFASAGAMSANFKARIAKFDELTKAAPFRPQYDENFKFAQFSERSGSWMEVQGLLPRLRDLLEKAAPALTAAQLNAARGELNELGKRADEWKNREDQRLAQQKLLEGAIVDLQDAQISLARTESMSDHAAAEARIAKVSAAVDAANALLPQLTRVTTDRLAAKIAQMRGEVDGARATVAARREEARLLSMVDALGRDVSSLPSNNGSVAELDRLAKSAESIQADIDRSKSPSPDVRKQLIARVQEVTRRIGQHRIDYANVSVLTDFAQALSEFERVVNEVEPTLVEGADTAVLDRATEELSRASASLKKADQVGKAVTVPAAASLNAARVAAGQVRLTRLVKRVSDLRDDLALSVALDAAYLHLDQVAADAWPADIAAISAATGKPGISATRAAEANRVLATLRSFVALYDALAKHTKGIEDAIANRDVETGRALVGKFSQDAKSPPLSKVQLDSIQRLVERYNNQFDAIEFWKRVVVILAVVAAVLLILLVALVVKGLVRPGTGSGTGSPRTLGPAIMAARVTLAERTRELQRKSREGEYVDQVNASDRLRRISEVATRPFVPAISGASMPLALWSEVYLLVMQLTEAGDAASAKKLLQLAADNRILPSSPWFKIDPFYLSHQTRLSNGSRATEAANAWSEVWKALNDPQSKEAADKEVGRWFEVAVEWLDHKEDVPVLYRRAIHERNLGRDAMALSLLVMPADDAKDPGTSAESRFKGKAASAVSRELCARVYLLAAQIKLDEAGVVKLDPVRSRLPDWPTLDAAPSVTAQSWGVGTADAGAPAAVSAPTAIELALKYLGLAGTQIGNASVYAPGAFSASPGVPAPATSLTQVPNGPVRDELVFRHGLMRFRYTLASSSLRDAEEILASVVLQEGRPGGYDSVLFDSAGTGRLVDGWSKLEGPSAPQLSPEDRVLVRELRLAWVRWCVNRAKLPTLRVDERNGKLGEAAWLICRYDLHAKTAQSLDSSERSLIQHSLRECAFSVLDMFEGQASQGPNSWQPRDSNDQWVLEVLYRLAGRAVNDPSEQWFKDLNKELREAIGRTWPWEADRRARIETLEDIKAVLDTRLQGASLLEREQLERIVGTVKERIRLEVGPVPVVVDPFPTVYPEKPAGSDRPTNVLLQTASVEPRLSATAATTVNAIRVIDPTMSSADFKGDVAWIEYGGGPLKAIGVFGHELNEYYSVPLKPEMVGIDKVFGASASLIGSVRSLADLAFDGLRELTGEFYVVLSRAAEQASRFGGYSGGFSLGGGYGLGASAAEPNVDNPADRTSWMRLKVTGVTARPAPGKQPPSEVSPELIERSLFDISVFIASATLDARPMPADAAGISTGSEAWRHLATFFRTELGVAEARVRDELRKRATAAAATGVQLGTGGMILPPQTTSWSTVAPGVDIANIDPSLLDLEFIRLFIRQMRLRAEDVRHREAEAAWQRMDPALKAAVTRLVCKFASRHKDVLVAETLKKRFGIDLGAPPPQSPPPMTPTGSNGWGGGQTPPPTRVPEVPRPSGDYHQFLLLAADACEATGGSRRWSYANDPGTLRRILGDMIATLEGYPGASEVLSRIRSFRNGLS
jgi:hypothetical protein